ncbi:MAG: hypothetical protein K2I23_04615 [Clostridia bacterium]|nr:hypothetical protein [Clostridia bacterium]
MKFKSIKAIIFSILTLACIAMCIFCLCLPMGIPSLGAPISMSEKIQVVNVDGKPVISGKIKNKSKETITLENQCLVIAMRDSYAGSLYLHITSKEAIVLEAGKEFDLSSVELEYEEYDYLKSSYKWGYDYKLDAVTVYPENQEQMLIFSKAVKEEGEIYATFSAILGAVFALIASFPIATYIRSKRRFKMAQSTLAKIEGGVYLRGAFCQEKGSKIKPSMRSKIKGDFKSLIMGVNIQTRYYSAEVMDFIITKQGFYIASAKNKTVDLGNMEFFDKEELDKTQIYIYKSNVVLNPLFNDNYFAFDVSNSKLSKEEVAFLLSQMFVNDEEIRNVVFDENSAQKNV